MGGLPADIVGKSPTRRQCDGVGQWARAGTFRILSADFSYELVISWKGQRRLSNPHTTDHNYNLLFHLAFAL
jgi:hypothetical protein